MPDPNALASYMQRRKFAAMGRPTRPSLRSAADLLWPHLEGRSRRTLNLVASAWEVIEEVLSARDGRNNVPEPLEKKLLGYAKLKRKSSLPVSVSLTVAWLYKGGHRTTTSKSKPRGTTADKPNVWAKAAEILMMRESQVINVYYSREAAALRERLGIAEIHSKTAKKKNLA
jgi:hypothetical protein